VAQTQTETRPSWSPPVEQAAAPMVAANGQAAANAVQLAAQLASRPNLAKSIIAAALACKAVPHDARVAFGSTNYAYTSSEAIFDEARQALAANGVWPVTIEETVDGHERDGPDRFELVSKRLLMHVSGECVLCVSHWPIIPNGDKRPLDKATAAASTLSLNYFLRNLLVMPRVDPSDEVAARDDRQQQPAKSAPATPPSERVTDGQYAELVALLNASGQGRKLADKILATEKIRQVRQLPAARFEAVKAFLAKQQPAGGPPADPTSGPTSTTGAAAGGGSSSPSSATHAQAPAPDRPTPAGLSPALPAAGSSAAPSSPASSSPPAAPAPNEGEFHSAIRQLHGRLMATKGATRQETWKDAVEFVTGKATGKFWKEPQTPDEAIGLISRLLTLQQIQGLTRQLNGG
jgi:hypothetical protein